MLPVVGRLPAVASPGRQRVVLLLAGLMGLLAAGCGTSAYEALLTQRLTDAKRLAPFTQLHPLTLVPDTRMRIRIPKLFSASYKIDSPHQQDGGKISPQRVQPPFLFMPGFQLCYEQFEMDAAATRLPFYCYLYALPANQGANLIAQIPIVLKQQFPDLAPAWEDTTVESEGGGNLAWKRLRVEGEQVFDARLQGKQNEFIKVPGVFELWLHETPDYIVMVGWRIPSSLQDKVHLLDLAPFTAGTLVIEPAPAEAPAQPAG